MSSAGIQIAETIQTGSINHHPSAAQDINPSTAADKKVRVTASPHSGRSEADDEDDDIPYSVLRPVQRTQGLPPLPDLRFEQSYLKSIENANGWAAIGWITFRDQVSEKTALRKHSRVEKLCADGSLFNSSSFPSSKALSGPSRH
jgi:Autophagy receptor ATG43